ncbi:MAG: TetR/AcrR family transcriptional regulator [Verrucomicrobiota bacterium]
MGISERKEREFLAREEMVVKAADGLLASHGYLGLNLDELAEQVEYSKATLYHHFKSKEDLVLGVVNYHATLRWESFKAAHDFKGLTRERITAFAMADRMLAQNFPHGFPLVQLVRSPSIWSKCSEERQAYFFQTFDRCFELAVAVAEDAAAQGELAKDAPQPDQIVWGLISLSKGAFLIAEEGSFSEKYAREPLRYLFDNYCRYLDGVGWGPSAEEHDYEATKERIQSELSDFSQIALRS